MGEQLALTYIINHVFLPPKLLQTDDHSPAMDAALMAQVLVSLKEFKACLPLEERSVWYTGIKMLSKMSGMRDNSGRLLIQESDEAFDEMAGEGTLNYGLSCF